MAALTETKNGLRVFKSDVAKYVQVMLGNMYTMLPGPEAPVLQLDGVWTFVAMTAAQYQNATGSAPPGESAYESMQKRKKGTYVLLDADAVAQNFEGNETPVVLMVVDSRELVKQLTDDPTSAMALIDPLSGAAAETKEKKKFGPVLMAAAAGGAGLIVGGPVVGAAAAGATYLLTA